MNQPVRCVLAVKDGFPASVDGVVQYGFHMSADDKCNMSSRAGKERPPGNEMARAKKVIRDKLFNALACRCQSVLRWIGGMWSSEMVFPHGYGSVP